MKDRIAQFKDRITNLQKDIQDDVEVAALPESVQADAALTQASQWFGNLLAEPEEAPVDENESEPEPSQNGNQGDGENQQGE